MSSINIRIYGNLRDLLKKKYCNGEISYHFLLPTTLKDVVESLGIPHTEVGLLLVNGKSYGWNKKISDGARLCIYPFFFQIDISGISRVIYKARKLKFIADVHLGRLAKYLRILGFDCLYQNNYPDEKIIEIALKEKRIILTMDRGILKHTRVKHGQLIRSKNVKEQLNEVMERFNLEEKKRPFTLCLDCNRKLEKISRREASKTFHYLKDRYYKEFYRCPDCRKVYYKGSHYYRMIKELI